MAISYARGLFLGDKLASGKRRVAVIVALEFFAFHQLYARRRRNSTSIPFNQSRSGVIVLPTVASRSGFLSQLPSECWSGTSSGGWGG
ncbi:hypothetical protein AVEN_131537-1 [Araneus ventricosus]|uniref:Uncharacterized protein n=1 Tax=Araneus ventricosus TaxID=182803 RepID=A0A4Y2M2E0_ARAVE|nr:hypothetical protein AVEN_131537-1 [Araneus ventricosus]